MSNQTKSAVLSNSATNGVGAGFVDTYQRGLRFRGAAFAASAVFFATALLCHASSIVLTGDTTITDVDVTYEGSNLVVQSGTVTIQGAHEFGALSVQPGAAVDSQGDSLRLTSLSLNAALMKLAGGSLLSVTQAISLVTNSTILCRGKDNGGLVDGEWKGAGVAIEAADVSVEAGSKITADFQGYVSVSGWYQTGVGPGGSAAHGGSSYGGQGTQGSNRSWIGEEYGSVLEPVDLGSSGGVWQNAPSGAGGGAIRLTVTGTLALNGVISANGGSPSEHSGAGAGGSVWVVTHTLTGAGRVEANGGNYAPGTSGGAGSGGRVAVYYANGAGLTVFDASTVTPGTGWNNTLASAGSLLFIDTSVIGLSVQARGNVRLSDPTNAFNSVTVNAGGLLRLADGCRLNVGTLRALVGSGMVLGGDSIVAASGLLQISSNVTVDCLSIDNAGEVDGAWAGRGATIQASNLVVEAGARITADGRGYVGVSGWYQTGMGPGGSANYGGSSHGGQGSQGNNRNWIGSAYGSVLEPVDLGSSGGVWQSAPSGAGGGAIRMIASETLSLDGVVSANGGSPSEHSGAGSGGSIWVTTKKLTGAGWLEAKGGNYNTGYVGGAGGGGRVAVYYADGAGFTGFATSSTAGGTGWNDYKGGDGSLLFIDTVTLNTGVQVRGDATFSAPTNTFGIVTVYGGSVLRLAEGCRLNVLSLRALSGSTVVLGGMSTVSASGLFQIFSNATVDCLSAVNGGQVDGVWAGRGVTILSSNVVVQAGGRITADGRGYVSVAGWYQTGMGPGASAGYGGASHAGAGTQGSNRNWIGGVYGDALKPVDLGSSGGAWQVSPSGAGGGAIRLSATGTLSLDGVISANGGSPGEHSGAGSGGSLWISAQTLTGAGRFEARGGNKADGYEGGAGGGGRVAVYYADGSGFTGFASSTTAGGMGWSGYQGGDGSIVFIDSSVSGSQLRVYDSAVLTNATTTFGAIKVHADGVLTLPARSALFATNLNVEVGGTVVVGGGATVNVANQLQVASNGVLICQSTDNTGLDGTGKWVGRGVTIQAGKVVVDAGGRISADGQGYVSVAGWYQTGIGPGGSAGYSGGSHAGPGTQGNNYNTVGAVYGSTLEPVDLGSSGGAWQSSPSGAGGGAIRLIVNGMLSLDGAISANGGKPAENSGAGAGGSLWVTTQTLKGAGRFEAVGGSFNEGYAGGAGGGGRVAVYYGDASEFTGFSRSTVAGGNGWNSNVGGRGSLLFQGSQPGHRDFDVQGDVQWLSQNSTFDIVNIRSGSLRLPERSTFNASALYVATGSTLLVGGGSTLNVSGSFQVASNALVICQGIDNAGMVGGQWVGRGVTINAGDVAVDAGGAIVADGAGYVAVSGSVFGMGPGGGQNYAAGGGGGYGGPGGQGTWGAVGGSVYGILRYPVDLGSSGGSGNWWGSWSSAGGGAIRLQATRTVKVDGVISASGAAGAAYGSGGGSGGSLWVTAAALEGAGRLLVNGAAGGSAYGGGGGGGRLSCEIGTLASGLILQSTGGNADSGGWGGSGGSVVLVYTSANAPSIDNVSVAPGAGGSSAAGHVVLIHDTDMDGLSDEDEQSWAGTNPNLFDTDGDAQGDGDEVEQGTDPNNKASFATMITGRVLYDGIQHAPVRVLATRDMAHTNRTLSLDGSAAGYLVHSTTNVNPRQGTVEGWICPTAPTWGFWRTHNMDAVDPLNWIAMFAYRDGNFYFRMGNGVSATVNDLTFRTAAYVPVNQWTHLACTWDDSAMRIFVNGLLVAERLNPSLQDTLDPMARLGGGYDQSMTGRMDDVRIWNRALTGNELRSSLIRKMTGAETGLVGLWNFDDGTGKDLTASGNHGILQAGCAILADPAEVYDTTLQEPGVYQIVAMPTLSKYTVTCFHDFSRNGAREFWEPQAAYTNNPLNVTNHVAGVNLRLPVVVPPTANAGGPYTADEFTGNVNAGVWTVGLDGSASTDTVSQGTLLTYQWNMETESFAGTSLDLGKWFVGEGVSQNGELSVFNDQLNWGTHYCFSRGLYSRASGISMVARVKFCRYSMVGFLNSGTTFNYQYMPYALHSSDGNLYVYEDGSQRARVGAVNEALWYDVRIDLKASQGAFYYLKEAGAQQWTLLYDSSYGSAGEFRFGVDVDLGRLQLDDITLSLHGPKPTGSFFGAGVHPVSLVVTDPTGLSATNSTTVTTTVNAVPAANAGPDRAQFESNAVDAVWTFTFSAADSTDDHGIWKYAWDWNNDGEYEEESLSPGATHSWGRAGLGTNIVALRVTDHALQTHVDKAAVVIQGGTAPTARPGGPYTFDEFTGNASAGAWNVVLNGTNSSDAESEVAHYLWDFGTETFDGTKVNEEKWATFGGNVTQSNALTIVNNGNAWESAGVVSRDAVVRGWGLALEAKVKLSNNHAMIGFLRNGASFGFPRMPYALYLAGGSFTIYEDGAARASVGIYEQDRWYEVRIELKPVTGARYMAREVGTNVWTQLYDSDYSSDNLLQRCVDVYNGTLYLDDVSEAAVGPAPTYRLYEGGAHPVKLTVWDRMLNSHSAETTITLLKNQPPVASAGGNRNLTEANAVEGLWTVNFLGSASTDDHGIYRYEWDWNYDAGQGFRPSGSVGVRQTRVFTTADLGARTIAVRVTDHVMQSSVAPATITISKGQPPVANAGSDFSGEVGYPLAFDGSGSSDDNEVASYRWDFGDGSTGVGKLPTHRYMATGTYTVTLVVYDNVRQASAPDTVQVTVVIGDLPIADAGGPYTAAAGGPPAYFDARNSRDQALGTAQGIVQFRWDADIALDSDGDNVRDNDLDMAGVRTMWTYPHVGTYTSKLTVVDGAGQTNVDFAVVQVVSNLPPNVLCVPLHGNPSSAAAHAAISGVPVRLTAVVRDAGPLTYQWNFGDGTVEPATPGVVSDPYRIEAIHTYVGQDERRFSAVLTVWDSEGLSGSDNYYLVIRPDTQATRGEIAVDNGLWWLHKDQDKTYGYWYQPYGGYYASACASAIHALEINGHGLNGIPWEDPYVETVTKGFAYLFTRLGPVAIGPQSAGNPDTNGNGIGVEVAEGDQGYQTGIVMDAIASSQAPLALALTGPAGVRGRLFVDILTDMVDMYAWGQQDDGWGRGGWRYGWNGGSDNSACQWGAIGLQAAQDTFGINVPQFVKDENRIWLRYSYDGHFFGYDGPGSYPWGWENTTPSALVQWGFDGDYTTNTMWRVTEDAIAANWSHYSGSSRNFYGLYAFCKAMRLARPSPVTTFQLTGIKWYDDPVQGVLIKLITQQSADGSWNGALDIVGGSPLGGDLSTAWAVVMLTPTLFVQPPVAVITAPGVWGYDLPLRFSAASSFHIDPERKIAKYQWDFNNDGEFELVTAQADDPAATWTFADPNPGSRGDEPQQFTVSLTVTDDAEPAQSDTAYVQLTIAEPPHAPYARITGPSTATENIPIPFSGAGSFDIDPTDVITAYQWDFNNDAQADLVTAQPAITHTFTSRGLQYVALRVVDNGVLNNGAKLTSEWAYASCEVNLNLAPVADAGGPYSAFEDQPVMLVGTNSHDPNGDRLFYAWDYDGVAGVDSTNPIATYTWTAPGTVTVWLAVNDSLLTNRVSTLVDVMPVNDAPAFTRGSDVTVDEDSGSYAAAWASAISAGPSDEAWQSLTFVCSNSTPALFGSQPALASNGTLSFTPVRDRFGSATVSVYLRDNGGVAHNGVDRSAVQTFQITVNPVNDAPVLVATNPVMPVIDEDAVGNAGQSISHLIAQNVTDIDLNPLFGVAVWSSVSTYGTWQFSTNAGTSWQDVGAVSTNQALHLRAQDKVRFVPDTRNGADVSLSYFAWDQTAGAPGAKASVGHRGGTTAYSLTADRALQRVLPVNDAPTDIGLSATSVTENQPTDTTVGALSATDPDSGDTAVYTLVAGAGSADNGSFSISGNMLKTAAVLDYETRNSYSIRVRVTDSGTATHEKQFTVTVNNANDAPTDVGLSASSVAENQPVGTAVGALSAVDQDAGDTASYTLVGGAGSTDNGSFSISGANLLTAASFDYEAKSSYSIRVRVTDSGSATYEKQFVITVDNVNEAPADISLSASSVAENQPVGTTVGALSAVDPDAGDTASYTLVSGAGSTDNGSFSISGSSLLTAASFDFEAKNSYSIRVRVTDSGSATYEKQFVLTVNNVNEAPTDISLSASSVAENQPVGTTVGTLSATDPDAGDTASYTLVSGAGSTDNGSFSISGNTLKTAAVFDFEAKNSYSIRVRVTDSGSATYEKQLAITVTDVPENAGTISLSAASYAIGEGAGTVTISVLRQNGVNGAASVSYTTANGSALAGSDYSVSSGTLNWGAGDGAAKTFTVPILNDSAYEDVETFTVTLRDATGASLGTPAQATVSITDNDPAQRGTLQFSASGYTVAENGGIVTVTVTRRGGTDGAASVNFATANVAATAGSDYTVKSGTLNWGAGDGADKTFTVTVLNDSVTEANEIFGVVLSSAVGAALGTPNQAAVTITDDDVPQPGTLQFGAATYTRAENGGSVTITVTRQGGTYGMASVGYMTVNGTATAGADYSSKSAMLNWAAGDGAAKTFTIPILNDSVYEGDETFTLKLGLVSGATLGTPSQATVTITEDDAPQTGWLQFSATSYSATESAGTVAITVVRQGGSYGAASVNYATADGTALAGADYAAAGGTLNWGAGDAAAKTFTVTINDDADTEPIETFTVTLSGVAGATLGTPVQATVKIAMNDQPVIGEVLVQRMSNGQTGVLPLDAGGTLGTFEELFASMAGWVARDFCEDGILLQQGDGGAVKLVPFDIDGRPVLAQAVTLTTAMPALLAAAIDGRRVLAQLGVGGPVFTAEFDQNWRMLRLTRISRPSTGLMVRGLDGDNILMQATTGAAYVWTLGLNGQVADSVRIYDGAIPGVILRSIRGTQVLALLGEVGPAFLVKFDIDWNMLSLTPISGLPSGMTLRALE